MIAEPLATPRVAVPPIWPLAELALPPIVLRTIGRTAELGYPASVACPAELPVFAARAGVIAFAAAVDSGLCLSIDHSGESSTHYAGLARMVCSLTDRFRGRCRHRVRAGDVVGHVAAPRLLFEVWKWTDGGHVVEDPATFLRSAVARPIDSPRPVAVSVLEVPCAA